MTSKETGFGKTLKIYLRKIKSDLPLFVVFRALGIISDKEILSYIIYDNDEPELKKKLYNLLIPSVKDSQPINDMKMAYKLLSLNTKGKDIINVIDFFIKPESNFITGQVIYLGGV